VVRAKTFLSKDHALGMDLKSLMNRFQAHFLSHGSRIPLHEGSIDFGNFLTIQTNDLSPLCLFALAGLVELIVAADIHLPY
jgi:hypothetical protein